MITKYTVLRANGAEESGEVDWPTEPGFTHIANLVCPLISSADELEHVTVKYQGNRRDMFVDERGTLKALPRNEKATKIYRSAYLFAKPGTNPEDLPFIHGDVVLFPDRRIWF